MSTYVFLLLPFPGSDAVMDDSSWIPFVWAMILSLMALLEWVSFLFGRGEADRRVVGYGRRLSTSSRSWVACQCFLWALGLVDAISWDTFLKFDFLPLSLPLSPTAIEPS